MTWRRVETVGRVPAAPNVIETMASDRTLASALMMGTNRGPRNASQFSCSWPPSTTSTSGTAATKSASWPSAR